MYIISTLGLGGAERVVCDLADEMFKKGHEVKLVYFLGEVMTRPANQGIEIFEVSMADALLFLAMSLKSGIANGANTMPRMAKKLIHKQHPKNK